MDFFQPACQSGPFQQARFGLRDDQNTTPAYVDTEHPDKWVATVENPSGQSVIFTAIDKCLISKFKLRFFRKYGFRIDLQAKVLIIAA